jgi:hypothetical protein
LRDAVQVDGENERLKDEKVEKQVIGVEVLSWDT